MSQVHLNSEEYTTLLKLNHQKSCFHVIVLDCGIAGMIRYFRIDNDVFYEDRLITDYSLCKKITEKNSSEDIHAEIYQKLALINYMYS